MQKSQTFSVGSITGAACSMNFRLVLQPYLQHVQALLTHFLGKTDFKARKLFISLIILIVYVLEYDCFGLHFSFKWEGALCSLLRTLVLIC